MSTEAFLKPTSTLTPSYSYITNLNTCNLTHITISFFFSPLGMFTMSHLFPFRALYICSKASKFKIAIIWKNSTQRNKISPSHNDNDAGP